MAQPSINHWRFARSPNYEKNVDMIYPYSEVPYIGEYKLVKIPISSGKIIVPESELIEHVDYWGEGRLDAVEGASGFTNCYNVNHQYQLVSNGTDRDRKIPNRIPVKSYNDCDTSSYIKDNSVKLVTVMGSPINKSCAKDIARIVNSDVGRIVIYGFESESSFVKNLEDEITKKTLLYCHKYNLPSLLKTISVVPAHDYRAYMGVTDLCGELYRNVLEGNYDIAANILRTLEDGSHGASVTDVVNRLLTEGKRNTTTFAYKLWNINQQTIVNHFPVAFKLIFGQDPLKIMSKKGMFTLKLDSKADSNNERACFVDSKDKTSESILWKIAAVFEDNVLYFKIVNTESNLILKLVDDGKEGDKKCNGAAEGTEGISYWFLDPVKIDDDVLFFIVNRKFAQGLKLGDTADTYGNKAVIGRKETVYGQPEVYGWYISPV